MIKYYIVELLNNSGTEYQIVSDSFLSLKDAYFFFWNKFVRLSGHKYDIRSVVDITLHPSVKKKGKHK